MGRDGGGNIRRFVRQFAACGTYRKIANAIDAQYGRLADAIDLGLPAVAPPGLRRELLTDIRRIPPQFEGFSPRSPPDPPPQATRKRGKGGNHSPAFSVNSARIRSAPKYSRASSRAAQLCRR